MARWRTGEPALCRAKSRRGRRASRRCAGPSRGAGGPRPCGGVSLARSRRGAGGWASLAQRRCDDLGCEYTGLARRAVPVDGEVYQGSSTITIEHLTGETKPVERTVGDAIPGGARNLEGMMIVKVTIIAKMVR